MPIDNTVVQCTITVLKTVHMSRLRATAVRLRAAAIRLHAAPVRLRAAAVACGCRPAAGREKLSLPETPEQLQKLEYNPGLSQQ